MKNTGTKRIKTERGVLRKMHFYDCFYMAGWYCAKEACDFSLGMEKHSLFNLLHFYAFKLYNYYFHRRSRFYHWVFSVEGKAQGVFQLNQIKDTNKYSFHYIVSHKQRGKGYSTEAVNAICDYMKTQDCKALYIIVDSKNVASVRIAEKCGFEFVSTKKDGLTYYDGRKGDRDVYKRIMNDEL